MADHSSDHEPLRGDEIGVMDAGGHRRWDRQADVIVIGLGGAGGSAAVEAREHGADVVLLDRFGGGGATGKSAGAVYFGGGTDLQKRFGFEDSPRNMYDYLRLETGDVVTEEVLRAFCETSVECFEWLRGMGCPFPVSGQVVKTALPPEDCTLYFSGNELCPPYCDAAVPAPRGHRPLGRGLTGHLITAALRGRALDSGVELRPYVRAQQLVVDGEGAVIGVAVTELPRRLWGLGEAMQAFVQYGGGMSHEIGSVEVGKWADLVLWRPAFFGIRPELVLKGGFIAWAQMGDPNASIPTPQPSYMRPMFGALGRATGATSIAFVSQRAVAEGHIGALGLAKRVNHVRRCRGIGKKDMKLNDALPVMKIDPETYEVFADGVLMRSVPATRVALARLYSMF